MLTDALGAVAVGSRRSGPATSDVPTIAWKSAYGVLAATALAVALGIGFFTYGGIFAPLSDAGGLLVGLLLVPLVRALAVLNRDDRLAGGVFLLGVAATAGIIIGSTGLLAVHLFSLDPAVYGAGFLGVQFVGWLLLGAWLLGVGALGLRTDSVAGRASWAAVASGVGAAGGIVSLVYSYAVGSFTPAFPLLMALYAVGFVCWAFWLGGELRPSGDPDGRDGEPVRGSA
ncbi:hypothetical protein [Halovivax sp.]|uniref:hypothetical protein n=1 Tax=Halovivax sp. TaxID=1935978 RepID=UPI0025C4D6CA|nr:hypothetical protein [Halovivax sp.]